MSHSCRSNSKFIVYPSHKVAVLAQTAIDAGDEITVSRVPVLEPTWKRRAMLFRLVSIYPCQRAYRMSFQSNYKRSPLKGAPFLLPVQSVSRPDRVRHELVSIAMPKVRRRRRRHSPRRSHGRGYGVELQSSQKHQNVLQVSRLTHGCPKHGK